MNTPNTDAFSLVAAGGFLFGDEAPDPPKRPAALTIIENQQAEIERLRALIHRDRTGLAHALNRVIERVGGSWWLTEGFDAFEGSRQEYQAEVAALVHDVVDIAKKALYQSGANARDAFTNCRPVRGVCESVPSGRSDCVEPPERQRRMFPADMFGDLL